MGFVDRLPAFIADPLRDLQKTPVRQSLHQILNLGEISASRMPICCVLAAGSCQQSSACLGKAPCHAAGLIVASALMSWKTLILITGSDSPVVVVLSGSMEPAFFRGDILFLNMGTAPLRTGEIVVYNAEDKGSIPVVHRIIEVHERQDTQYIDILTKVTPSAPPPGLHIHTITAPANHSSN